MDKNSARKRRHNKPQGKDLNRYDQVFVSSSTKNEETPLVIQFLPRRMREREREREFEQ